jgi:lipid-binding SYLF domain-containing protein
MKHLYAISANAADYRSPASRAKAYLYQLMWLTAIVVLLGLAGNKAIAATAEDLNTDAVQALNTLYKTSPAAERISKTAKAILVFPKVTKAGLVFGGSYGEGVLLKAGRASGYYNTISASWGWQAGAESYGYVVFLMNNKAIKYLNASKGWELGVDPTVVVVDAGAAKNFSTSTLKDNAYAFVFDQQGLMGSISIEGTKISRIKR